MTDGAVLGSSLRERRPNEPTAGAPARCGARPSGAWAGARDRPRRYRNVDDAPTLRPRVVAHQLERGAIVEPVALHHDALRALDHRAPLERRLELVDLDLQPRGLLVAPQRDLDRALDDLRRRGLDPRGDPALGGARDELDVAVARL